MKKLALVLAVLLIGLAAAAEIHVIKDDTNFGCVEKDDYSRLVGYLVDGDRAIFESELTALMYQEKATIFEQGEKVYLEDTGILSGMIQIRRAGEPTAYWTALEAIE